MSNIATERYQNIIVGSGESGKYLAWHLAKPREPTVVIERRWIGGSCPNLNSLPTKNEIWSAKVVDLTRRAGEFGISASTVATDMAQVLKRKRDMVAGLVAMHLEKYKSSGADAPPLHFGVAEIDPQRELEARGFQVL